MSEEDKALAEEKDFEKWSNGELPENIKLEIEIDGKIANDLLIFAHMQGMDIKLYCESIIEEKWGSILDIMQVEH